ncbi:MAG: HD domain-containing protein [Bacillota bacterium]
MPQIKWEKWFADVEPYYRSFPPSHDFSHIQRVFHSAMRIGAGEGADLYILGLAALLHDMGRPKEEESEGELCHAEVSAAMAKGLLLQKGTPLIAIKRIIHCIDSHRYRGGKKPLSLEARCLFDADKLDSLGAIGIARSYLWLGEHGGPVYGDPEMWGKFDPGLKKPEYDSLQREWAIKYRYIKERLFTKTARDMALGRHAFMENFLEVLENEIKSGL